MSPAAGFVPARGLAGAHRQTLAAALLPAPRPPLARERIELPDGDFIDLDWHRDGRGPSVLVLHGLEGDSRSAYARRLLATLAAHGMRAGVLHARGRSGEPNRLPRSYTAGDWDDLAFVLARQQARDGRLPAVVGYSLGANLLLKYLGETAGAARIGRAVAVSPPFDLARAAARLDRGWSRLYQWHLLRSLRATYRQRLQRFPAALPIDARALDRLHDFRSFDDRVTAPLHGYAGVDDYYGRCSCRQYLGTITVPTLILHADDDPFLYPDAIPAASEASPAVHLQRSAHGGHVGFIAGTPWRPQDWLSQRIAGFLATGAPALA